MSAVNRAADAAPGTLRVSMDAKAAVKIGPFARRGTSRVRVAAADHDCQPEATLTPVGLLLPATDELFLYGVTSRVTSDCLVDCLTQWWAAVCGRFTHSTTLVLNLDNGPESHRHRTQFMHRLVQFAQHYHLTVRLAYYPPTTASTTRWSAAGASWSSTGTAASSTRSTPSWAAPRP